MLDHSFQSRCVGGENPLDKDPDDIQQYRDEKMKKEISKTIRLDCLGGDAWIWKFTQYRPLLLMARFILDDGVFVRHIS